MVKKLMIGFLAGLAAMAVQAQTFSSTAVRVDTRQNAGIRTAADSEMIYVSPLWQNDYSASNCVATVTYTSPDGAETQLYSTSTDGIERFVWNAKTAVAGEHLFKHTIWYGATVVATQAMKFNVPEPTIETLDILGPEMVRSGGKASYVCTATMSDGSTNKVIATWSICSGTSYASINSFGELTAGQVISTQGVTVEASYVEGGVMNTATKIVKICPDSYFDFEIIGGVLTLYRGLGGAVEIPAGVTTIGDNAFSMSGVTSLTIPSGVASIGSKAFQGCMSLASVTIPSSVTSIGSLAFADCDALKEIHVDSGDSDRVKKLLLDSGLDVSSIGLVEPDSPTAPNSYTVAFDANGGTGTMRPQRFDYGEAQALTSNEFVRTGYAFAGWGDTNGTVAVRYADGEVVSNLTAEAGAVVTLYAQWEPDIRIIGPEDDRPMDAENAVSYDGVITDADGLPIGSLTVKASKITKAGLSRVTATIQMAGEAKKVTVKGEVKVSEAVISANAKDGRLLDLMFTRNTISGTFDGYLVEGTRNALASAGSSQEKADAEAVLNRLIGNYAVAYEDETGWSGLTLAVMKKGKCKFSGTLANGKRVSVAGQLILSEDYCCVPFIYTKNDTNLAAGIYFPNDGSEPVIFGLYAAVISPVVGLGEGCSFQGGGEIYNLLEDYDVQGDFLPYGTPVVQEGTKWIVAGGAKAGRIKMNADGNVQDVRESENPSGLKLSFTSKTGVFKGSFKVYAVDAAGRLKNFAATVNGVVVDGYGYGTATIKKFGSVPVTVE